MTRWLLTMWMACLLVLPVKALAQEGLEEEYHKNIKVYQPKPILKKQRVQLTGFGMASINPRMVAHLGAGGMLDYHISERFSVGAQFTQFFPFETPFKDQVEEDFGLFPERTELGWLTTLRVGVTPLFGKFGAGYAPYWDFSAYLGGGVMRTVLTDLAPTIEAGVGFRFYMTRWLAISAEVLDYIYFEDFQQDTEVLQAWMARAGVSLFVPFTFKYGED